ncbi:waprin-Phi3-like [Anolis sagrei]|uniref:waprin-Phi3-like n=1 Tax=Anolis sagrei TaxID=38937 RepID=UPI00352068BF
MGPSVLALLVGLLVLCPEPTSANSPKRLCPKEKPGKCPVSPASETCKKACLDDNGCPGDLKCCFKGCGRSCEKPVITVKPGVCPLFKIPAGLPCEYKCCQDSDCLGDEKCCPQGPCRTVCFTPGF